MLKNLKDLQGYSLRATDGDIGTVKDFYFDDERWVVRYLVVETGNWLASRKVLVSPISIGAPLHDEMRVAPMRQVVDGPREAFSRPAPLPPSRASSRTIR